MNMQGALSSLEDRRPVSRQRKYIRRLTEVYFYKTMLCDQPF